LRREVQVYITRGFIKEGSPRVYKRWNHTYAIVLIRTCLQHICDVWWRCFFNRVGIPTSTNCPPLLADLFLYSHEAHFRNPDRNHKLWNVGSTEKYRLDLQMLLEFC
jgi:hypothetical protein